MGTAGHRAPRPPAVHSLVRQSPRSSPSLAGFLLLTGTSNFARDQLLDATSPASLAAPTACATVDDGCPGRKRAWTGVRDSKSAMTTVVVECQADVCQKADHPRVRMDRLPYETLWATPRPKGILTGPGSSGLHLHHSRHQNGHFANSLRGHLAY